MYSRVVRFASTHPLFAIKNRPSLKLSGYEIISENGARNAVHVADVRYGANVRIGLVVVGVGANMSETINVSSATIRYESPKIKRDIRIKSTFFIN